MSEDQSYVVCPWCHEPVEAGIECDRVLRGWQGCLRSYRCAPCDAFITVTRPPVFVGTR